MRNWLKKLYHAFLYRLSLKQKLIFSYVILIVIPMLLLTFFSYSHISKTLVSQFQYSSDQALLQTSIYLDKILSEISDSTDQIAFNRILSEDLYSDDPKASIVDIYGDYLTASGLLKGVFTSDILYSVEIFVDGNPIYTSKESRGQAGISFIRLSSDTARTFDEQLSAYSGSILYLPPRTIHCDSNGKDFTAITALRYIKELSHYANIGILSVNIEQSAINSIIRRAVVLPGSFSLLMDNTGTILAVSDQTLMDSCSVSGEIVKNALSTQQTFFQTENMGRMMINSRKLSKNGWTLLSVTPYKEMLKTNIATRNQMILLMVLISSLFFVLAFFISKSIADRISVLARCMKDVPLNRCQPLPDAFGTDEVSILTKSYNYMLKKIDDYADSQYQLGLALKNSELKALQAQINPHFLYNTLDLLNWLAQDYGADEISDVVSLLSQYYRLSLNRGQEILSVADAVKHIEVYIKLQNFRFSNSIRLELDFTPETKHLAILNLLIQPIVENAILHGILEKETPSGTIRITGFVKDGRLCIRISDNGIGMTAEQIDALTDISDDSFSRSSGFGIKNVISRIQLFYGPEYGLRYESTPQKGTIVYIEIPCIPYQSEN